MVATHTWILKDQQYRWVHVTPQVVSADPQDRLPHSHLIHISLVAVSPSLPLCGKYRRGEYHPWPLTTRTIDDGDACGACIKAVQHANPRAFFEANHMLLVRGEAELFPGAPVLPTHIIEQMAEMAALVQQQQIQLTHQQTHLMQLQRLIQSWAQSLLEAGVPISEAMLALTAPSAGTPPVETLFTYDHYRTWCEAHWGIAYIVRITGSLIQVHLTNCIHVINQAAGTYTPRWGVLTDEAVWEHFPQARGCGDCHTGPPIQEKLVASPFLLDETMSET
jgi:cellobiose-specific phosphotransferase system component IIA